MATATTTTITAAAAGMAEIVVDAKTITNTVQSAVVAIPFSKTIAPAYQNARPSPGKVMVRVTTATISVVAIGTAATVASKQIRN